MSTLGKRDTPPGTVHIFAGGMSAFVSSILLQPFDVVKTRMQRGDNASGRWVSSGLARKVDVHTIRQSPFLKGGCGLLRTFGSVVGKEGAVGLWRGTLPTLYRTVPGVGIYFYSLDLTKRAITGLSSHQDDPRLSRSELVAAGGLARVWVVGLTLPFTVLKTRFESGLFSYTGMHDAMRRLFAQEGIAGFYRGFFATALRDAPFSGIYYASYEELKGLFETEGTMLAAMPVAARNMAAGFSAGLLATVVTHPPDVVRTRMQLFPALYSGTAAAISRIAREEGAAGFMRGMSARMLRRALMSAMTWTMYEEAMSRVARWAHG